jgi:hypothetical protein
MDTFYVVLPSNTPEPNTPLPANNTANYTVRLPNTIDLSEGDWSVALSSIIYPVSFQSAPKEEMFLEILYYELNQADKKFKIPENITFTDIAHLEKTINETIIGHAIERTKRSVETIPEETMPNIEDEQLTRDKRVEEWIGQKDTTLTTELKQLHAAKNEVQDRSYKAVDLLSRQVDDKIGKIDKNAEKIEEMETIIKQKVSTNENFTKPEAHDFLDTIIISAHIAKEIQKDALDKKQKIADFLEEYGKLLSEINTHFLDLNVVEARKIANKAKDVVKRLRELDAYIMNKFGIINDTIELLHDKGEELDELSIPVDIGMKNNIARIRENILKRVKNPSDLEVYFYYDENFGRFFLYNHKPKEVKGVKLSPLLAYMLGFVIDKDGLIKRIRMRREGGFATFSPDINAGIHQLYVYMPGIIESSYLGNVQAPILRIVNVDKPPNSIAESIYTNMYFIKVIEKRISSIKIQIKNSFGEFVKFNWGTAIITLAFRRNLF